MLMSEMSSSLVVVDDDRDREAKNGVFDTDIGAAAAASNSDRKSMSFRDEDGGTNSTIHHFPVNAFPTFGFEILGVLAHKLYSHG